MHLTSNPSKCEITTVVYDEVSKLKQNTTKMLFCTGLYLREKPKPISFKVVDLVFFLPIYSLYNGLC